MTRLAWHRGRLRLLHRNEHGTWWFRVGPWWRVWPDVAAHRLSRRGLISHRLQSRLCAWRGGHGSAYGG